MIYPLVSIALRRIEALGQLIRSDELEEQIRRNDFQRHFELGSRREKLILLNNRPEFANEHVINSIMRTYRPKKRCREVMNRVIVAERLENLYPYLKSLNYPLNVLIKGEMIPDKYWEWILNEDKLNKRRKAIIEDLLLIYSYWGDFNKVELLCDTLAHNEDELETLTEEKLSIGAFRNGHYEVGHYVHSGNINDIWKCAFRSGNLEAVKWVKDRYIVRLNSVILGLGVAKNIGIGEYYFNRRHKKFMNNWMFLSTLLRRKKLHAIEWFFRKFNFPQNDWYTIMPLIAYIGNWGSIKLVRQYFVSGGHGNSDIMSFARGGNRKDIVWYLSKVFGVSYDEKMEEGILVPYITPVNYPLLGNHLLSYITAINYPLRINRPVRFTDDLYLFFS